MNKITASTEIAKYTFPVTSTEVRTVVIDGNPWFVASDVTDILEIGRTHDAVRGLDDDEKGTDTIRTLGGYQTVTVINESGLYSLVLRSRKSQAKAFKKWITSEVIPAIRKTGSYGIANTMDLDDPLDALERQAAATMKAIEVAKTERVGRLVAEQKVLEMAPAAEMGDLYAQADNHKELRSFARDIQQLGIDRNIKVLQKEVFDYMGKIGVIIRNNRSEHNQATAKALKEGWALNTFFLVERSDGTFEKKSSAKLTAMGEQYVIGRAARTLDKYSTLNIDKIQKLRAL